MHIARHHLRGGVIVRAVLVYLMDSFGELLTVVLCALAGDFELFVKKAVVAMKLSDLRL